MSSSEMTAAAVVQRAITQAYERLVAQEHDLRIADDPESVHQARVATRRLRSDLKTFEPFVDAHWASELRAELRWLGSELGAVRDIEVLRDRLRVHARALPPTEADAAQRVVRRLDADRAAARPDLVLTLMQPRYSELRAKLAASAAYPRLTEAAYAPGTAPLVAVVRGALEEAPPVGPRPR